MKNIGSIHISQAKNTLRTINAQKDYELPFKEVLMVVTQRISETPGKTFIGKPLKDLPYGQSGTERLSFRLRRLQRNAKHPACLCSLRSILKKRCRDSGLYSPENCGHSASFRDAPSSYAPDRNFLLLKSRDSTLLSPTAPKGP